MQHRSFMPVGMILLGLAGLVSHGCRVSKNSGNEGDRPLGLQTADATAAQSVTRASCSKRSAYKIVGGQSVSEDTQVAAATLKLIIRNQRFCTATLIGDHHIVTAAHCVVDVKDPGDIKIGSGLDGKIHEKLEVDVVKIHPKFVGVLSNEQGYLDQTIYDVAAIHFKGTLPEGLSPVGLAAPSEIQVGMPVVVSGYGVYGSDDKTRRPLSQVETRLSLITTEFLELQIATDEGRGACYGDSGGPTFIVDPASSCLLLIGSTTGPGRDSDYTCESGGATLMDLTRYQSWLACTFKKMNQPLEGLITSLSTASACDSK